MGVAPVPVILICQQEQWNSFSETNRGIGLGVVWLLRHLHLAIPIAFHQNGGRVNGDASKEGRDLSASRQLSEPIVL